MGKNLVTLLAVVLQAVQSINQGPIEVVEDPTPMRFEYKDSFTLFAMENKVCEGSVLAVRNQNFILRPVAAENIKFMIITSEKITNCSSMNWVGCPNQALFCDFITAERIVDAINEKDVLISNLPCIEELYFYLFPKDKTDRAAVAIYSRSSPKLCRKIELDYCVAQGYEMCSNNFESNCGTVKCIANGQFHSGYCYPDLNDIKAYEICNINAEWALDSNHEYEYRLLQPPKNYSIFNFVLALIVLVILCTCCCSIYYRFRLKSDGFAPFSAPSYCPSFLFPLPDYIEADYASINNGMVPLRVLRTAD